MIALLLAVSLCAGHVLDHGPRPMAPRARPALGVPYLDSEFGSKVTRITNANPVAGFQAVIKPLYPTMRAWNVDESLLLLWDRVAGHVLYEGRAPHARIGLIQPFAPTDIESVMWSRREPRVLYYPTNYRAFPALIRQEVLPAKLTVQHDFSTAPTFCPIGDWTALLSLGSDPEDSGDAAGELIGLRCGNLRFLYSVSTDRVVMLKQIAPGYANAIAPARSEDVGVLERFVWDQLAGNLVGFLFMANPYEHGSFGRSFGRDVWNAVAFTPGLSGDPAGTLVSYDLRLLGSRTIIGPSTGWPDPPNGTHVTGTGPGPWVAVGVVGNPDGQRVLDQEILLANVETGEVCRLAHAHTFAGATAAGRWGYWSEIHLVLSPSGKQLAFPSDWGNGDAVNTYILEVQP